MFGDTQFMRKWAGPAQRALPACPYRDRAEDASYSCGAAEGECVTPDDCRCCFIPEAIAQETNCPFVIALQRHGMQGCTGQVCDRDASG